MRTLASLALIVAVSVFVAPPVLGHGEETHAGSGVIVVGADAASDVHPLIADDEPGPTYRPKGADLRLLLFEVDGENITVRLEVEPLPDAPLQVVYVVAFHVADRPYHVCWDPQQVAAPDTRAGVDGLRGVCGHVAEGTRLGPATTGTHPGADMVAGGPTGVTVEERGQGDDRKTSIAWRFDADALPEGMPRFVTDVRAVAWAPGAPAASAWWHLARAPYAIVDRAPDTGTWTVDLGVLERPRPVPGLPRLLVTPRGETGDRAVADRGDNVTFRLRVQTHDIPPWGEEHAYTVRLLGETAGFDVAHAPARFTLAYKAGEQEVRTNIRIGEAVAYERDGHRFQWVVCHDKVEAPHDVEDPLPPNGCAEWPLRVLVTPPAAPSKPAFQAPTGPPATPSAAEAPAPSPFVAVAVFLVAVLVWRHRRAA